MTAGFQYHPAALTRAEQDALARVVFAAAADSPFFQPITPSGKPMSVRMTGFGPLSWITDAKGYRYEPSHPLTGRPWPPMPQILLDLWKRYAPDAPQPDACLANLYRDGAKMGLHHGPRRTETSPYPSCRCPSAIPRCFVSAGRAAGGPDHLRWKTQFR